LGLGKTGHESHQKIPRGGTLDQKAPQWERRKEGKTEKHKKTSLRDRPQQRERTAEPLKHPEEFLRIGSQKSREGGKKNMCR